MLDLLGCLEGWVYQRTVHSEARNTDVVGLLLALLSTTTETKHKVQRRLLLDVVVVQRTAILKLLASENQALLIWWNSASRKNEIDSTKTYGTLTLPCPVSLP